MEVNILLELGLSLVIIVNILRKLSNYNNISFRLRPNLRSVHSTP